MVIGDLPGIMRVVAGIPEDQGPGEGGAATRRELAAPWGLGVAANGVLYVSDPAGGVVLAVHSNGDLDVLADRQSCDGTACLRDPTAVQVEGSGTVVVADRAGGRIWRLDPATWRVTVVAGNPGGVPPAPGVPATGARLGQPTGLALDDTGGILFSDRSDDRIWRIDPGGSLALVAGTGAVGNRGDGGPAVAAQFSSPGGLALGGGLLYVADTGNNRVRVVDLAAGTIDAFAGTAAPGFGGDDGLARLATLRFPEDVTLSEDGLRLFITDRGNRRVRSVSLASGTIRTFAGTGDETYTGNRREAGETALSGPTGLAAGSGFLFIADAGLRLVWRTPVRFGG